MSLIPFLPPLFLPLPPLPPLPPPTEPFSCSVVTALHHDYITKITLGSHHTYVFPLDFWHNVGIHLLTPEIVMKQEKTTCYVVNTSNWCAPPLSGCRAQCSGHRGVQKETSCRRCSYEESTAAPHADPGKRSSSIRENPERLLRTCHHVGASHAAPPPSPYNYTLSILFLRKTILTSTILLHITIGAGNTKQTHMVVLTRNSVHIKR